MIPFNKPPYVGGEEQNMIQAIHNCKISGDGEFTKNCQGWLEEHTNTAKALLTTSCTSALEMSAMLCGIQSGDEVIMPSYTFVSTADAFVNRGAKIVFVDIRPDTMNIDEHLIEEAITERTKVIVPVHYAGVGCEMDTIMDIANKRGLYVVEDAAQGMCASYKGKALGTFGDFGTYSYHETKNYSMGEGGAILINRPDRIEKAEIIREKGTNRNQFFRGLVDKYTWVEPGSSYLPSDMNAAYLWTQLQRAEEIYEYRMHAWKQYNERLQCMQEEGLLELPYIPTECIHNAHMFYIKVEDLNQRTNLLSYLRDNGVLAVFHYVPLHSSKAGKEYGRFYGEDRYTTTESERLIRLPMFYGITDNQIEYISEKIYDYFKK